MTNSEERLIKVDRQGFVFEFHVTMASSADTEQLKQVHRFGRITGDWDITPRYAWARFTNNEYYDTWSNKLFDRSKTVLKATLNGTVVGLGVLGEADRGEGYDAIWERFPHLCELHQMYVVAGYQNSGIGTAMFRLLVEKAKAKGHDAMVINLLTGNAQALRFYQHMGAVFSATVRETKSTEPHQPPIEISCDLLITRL